jgi:hypothetical protein
MLFLEPVSKTAMAHYYKHPHVPHTPSQLRFFSHNSKHEAIPDASRQLGVGFTQMAKAAGNVLP